MTTRSKFNKYARKRMLKMRPLTKREFLEGYKRTSRANARKGLGD